MTTPTTPTTPVTVTEDPESTVKPVVPDAPVEEAPPAETPPATPEDELPEWARKELTSVRGEAANYRTRLREAEAKLSQAKTPEEVEAALAEMRHENAALARSVTVANVAREFELPNELAELLKGDDEAALKLHAKALQKFISVPDPGSLSGGLTPDEGDDGENDPRKLARRTRR